MTTPDEDAAIQRAVEDDPFTNAVRIREQLQLNVSAETVRRRLHRSGKHHRVPAVKECLTNQHRAARLAFARQHVEKDLEFWSRVVFTDEKTFCSTNHGKIHLWRSNNTRYA